MTAVIARIALRYAAGALVARGILGMQDASFLTTDPDIAAASEIAIGAALAGLSESWYFFAHRFGWAK